MRLLAFLAARPRRALVFGLPIVVFALAAGLTLGLSGDDNGDAGGERSASHRRGRRLWGRVAGVADADTLLDQLEALSNDMHRPEEPTPIHSDFNAGQILVNNGQITLLDFDQTCLGDPAMDVGNFMATLRRHALSRPAANHHRLPALFLADYVALSSNEAVAERAHLYEAITLLSSALRIFEANPRQYERKGDSFTPVRLLHEIAACLDKS